MSKLFKTKRDSELYYYYNAKKEKRWMFRHRFYDSYGNRREKSKQGFKYENGAYRELLEVRTSILNGDVKQVENSNIRISEWLDIWYETKKTSWKSSTRNIRKRIIQIIKPRIGKYKLAKLDLMTYERVFINDLLKTYSPNTVRMYHNIFKIAVNAAVKNKTIKENNIAHATVPEQTKIDNFLSQHDLNKLLSAAKKEGSETLYTAIVFLANTGVRKGEAQGLKWKDIDFENKTVTIERTRDEDGTRSPKTSNSYRTIYLDDKTLRCLKKYQIWCKEYKLRYGEHLNIEDYVFISKHGAKPISHMFINKGLATLIEKTGIKKITPHGLRHTHATILLNNKVSIPVVAKRLGNTQQE